jgi:hypothetical protein
MQKQLCTFLLVFISGLGWAQKPTNQAYIITLSGDTLPGKVQQPNARSILFTGANTRQPKQYTPGEINGYIISGDQYYAALDLSTDYPGEPLFARLVSKGYFSLFVTFPQAEKPLYVLQKNDGSLVVLKDKQFRGILKINLTECPAFDYNPTRQKSTSYTEGDLSKLLREYNSCVSPQTPQLDKRRKLYLNYGLLAGAATNQYYYVLGGETALSGE